MDEQLRKDLVGIAKDLLLMLEHVNDKFVGGLIIDNIAVLEKHLGGIATWTC